MVLESGLGWWMFIGLMVVVGVGNLILNSQRFARRRYARIAHALGFSYEPEARSFASLGCDVLPFFAWRKERRNLMHGSLEGVETAFVEIGENVPEADPIMGDAFTPAVCFRLRGRDLPAFVVLGHRGEGKHAVAKDPRLKGHVAVDLHDNSGFPFHLLVLAEREADVGRVRALFPRSVQDSLMERRDFLFLSPLHGAGEWMGLLGVSGLMPQSSVKWFREDLERARAVVALFAA